MELHFSRDCNTGVNLALSDKRLGQDKKVQSRTNTDTSRARGTKMHDPADLGPGGVVYLKSDGRKHTNRDPLLVNPLTRAG